MIDKSLMMRKLFTILIITFIAIFGLSSCSDEAFDVDSVNKQTVLIFMPWSGSATGNGLYHDFTSNLLDIKSGIVSNKGLKGTRVLVFLSKPEDSGNIKSYLYELQYNGTTKEVDDVILDTYEGKDFTTDAGITQILNEVKEKAEALNYAMIIGGHGSGWTSKEDWQAYPNYAKPHRITRFFGSVDDIEDYGIDVSTLAKGIENSGIKMQYILFDACYMENVETAYELRNATYYLVGSTSEILNKGVPYSTIWSYLNTSTPSYSGIVTGFYNYYNSLSTPYGALSAVDCRQVEKLASIMKEINSKYTITEEKLAGVQKLDGFKSTIFYDLGNYVDSLVPKGLLKEQFEAQLKQTVKSAQSTSQLISSIYSTTYFDVKDFSGLTISDPSTHPAALRGKEKTEWWQATH